MPLSERAQAELLHTHQQKKISAEGPHYIIVDTRETNALPSWAQELVDEGYAVPDPDRAHKGETCLSLTEKGWGFKRSP